MGFVLEVSPLPEHCVQRSVFFVSSFVTVKTRVRRFCFSCDFWFRFGCFPKFRSSVDIHTQKEQQKRKGPMLQSLEVVFVGTGVSTAIPVMGHFGDCACKDAVENPTGKNKRNNVSLLLSAVLRGGSNIHPRQTRDVNVLIDVGKTFRQAYFETLIKRNIRHIDALLLTHDHADAVAGLDDVRDLQPWRTQGLDYICDYYVPTYLMPETLRVLEQQVGYIIRNSRKMGLAPADPSAAAKVHDAVVAELPDTSRVITRRSTALNLWTLPSDAAHAFSVHPLGSSLPFYSIPVEHGKGYMSLGFVFGTGARLVPVSEVSLSQPRQPTLPCQEGGGGGSGECFVYISDVSSIPDFAMLFLKQLERIDYLVIDLLLKCEEKHFSHFTWTDLWVVVRELLPRKVLCVGMYCDLKHEESNQQLTEQLASEQRAGLCRGVESVQLAYDGMSVNLQLRGPGNGKAEGDNSCFC